MVQKVIYTTSLEDMDEILLKIKTTKYVLYVNYFLLLYLTNNIFEVTYNAFSTICFSELDSYGTLQNI